VYTLSVVIGAALMATGVGHLIASTLQLVELQSEVNERLPQSEKFEPLFWTLGKRMQLRSLQKNSLPQSPRFWQSRAIWCHWCLCIFLRGGNVVSWLEGYSQAVTVAMLRDFLQCHPLLRRAALVLIVC
jgi:hypothetical protein